ncbi:MAG: hypothetical protein AAGI11_15105 [Pseudomonadota bacterium]
MIVSASEVSKITRAALQDGSQRVIVPAFEARPKWIVIRRTHRGALEAARNYLESNNAPIALLEQLTALEEAYDAEVIRQQQQRLVACN